MTGDPILRECLKTYPNRPEIDPATTIYTREELNQRIDGWMYRLGRLQQGSTDDL